MSKLPDLMRKMNKLICALSALLLALSLPAQDRSTFRTEMEILKQKYGIGFVYDASLGLDASCQPVVDLASLQISLQELFRDSGIDYELRGKTVILHKEGEPDRPWVDTLAAAVKTDWQTRENPGTLQSDMPRIRSIISPLGEGDPLRWVQTLPGVATGADGTSALYVRGGNLGNNLLTLDGVPVYGYSHLLGLTTVIPPEAVESVSLSRGGFEGGQGNFTASHLRIRSKVPGMEGQKTSFSISNFLVSASTEGKAGKQVSYSVSGRISPLALEYRAFRKMLPDVLREFDGFGAGVGDLYGQVRWQISPNRQMSGFVLGSLDHYRFSQADGTGDSVGWNNIIASVGYQDRQGGVNTEVRAYVNRYASSQVEEKTYRGEWQKLSLRSVMTEFSLAASQTRQGGAHFRYSYGLNFRDALFNPGQVASVSHFSNGLLTTAWIQGNYDIPEKLSLMLSVRGNLFTRFRAGETFFTPDAGFAFKWHPVPQFGLDLTFDRSSQFYHTLEGLPTGWSLDIVVPSGKTVRPETATQAYAGLDFRFGRHGITAGAFRKWMQGLVYFKYAPTLFSGALAEWEEHVDTGRGNAYGAEFQYEYAGKDLQVHIAYTWSRTNREGFTSVLDGAPFHARFDRQHVLNASASWRGFQVAFTYQSGHWENSVAQQAQMHFLSETWTAEYFNSSGVNDYHMPDVLRLDLGYQFKFDSRRCHHELNIGVCNVTNHFNPFMLYYNAQTEEWEEIALLPILPNLSYKISF